MTETLPADLQQFVREELAAGRYASPAEVIGEGLRLLRDRERRLQELRAEIQVGIDELERGEGIVIRDERELAAFFEDIKVRGRERLENDVR